MSLCFVSNKDLTVPFSDIARRLKESGEEIVWLVPSRRWSQWLLAEGWPKRDILNLAEYADEWRDLSIEQSAASLADIEGEAPATIGNVIQMCRNLRQSPPRFAYAYLAVARRHVEPFLRDRGVEVVFGEGTWGFEQLIWLVCGRHGIPMLTPTTTRLPGDRFYFADAVSTAICSFADTTPADLEWASEFLPAWLNRPVQPEYMRTQMHGYTAFRARWLKELAIGLFRPALDRHDATLWSLRSRIADRTTRYLNSLASKYLRPYQARQPAERYVLYPLHHQPEASIDVYGSLNSNQLALIETLSRLLPVTHKLWVKEHRSGIGDRSMAWYRKVMALPNVRLISPFEETYALIRGADLVVTISGTAAYEAALMGISAVGLAPIFFSPLLTNRPDARSHPLEWRMRELLSADRASESAEQRHRQAVEFLAHLRANSAPGHPAEVDATASRRASADYMRSETEGFSRLLHGLRARKRSQP